MERVVECALEKMRSYSIDTSKYRVYSMSPPEGQDMFWSIGFTNGQELIEAMVYEEDDGLRVSLECL